MTLAETHQGMTPRRLTVLRSVAATFAERGFRGVGMRELGQATGLNPGTLYHHFKSKNDALLTICTIGHERTLADLTAVLDADVALKARIDALFERHTGSLMEVGDFIQVYSNHRLELPADMAEPLSIGWATYRRGLHRLFEDAGACGEIEQGINPSHLGRMLVGQIRIVNQLHRKGRMEEIPSFVALATRLLLAASGDGGVRDDA